MMATREFFHSYAGKDSYRISKAYAADIRECESLSLMWGARLNEVLDVVWLS